MKPPSLTEREDVRKQDRQDRKKIADKAYPNGRSAAQRAKDNAAVDPNRPNKVKRHRKVLKVAKIKRHEVTGIRPKGAVR